MHDWFRSAFVLFTALGVWALEPIYAASGGGERVESALKLCHRAAAAPSSEKEELLVRGLELAQAAVDATPESARARLALFCNLGTRLKQEGVGFSTLSKLRRLKREIERAAELGPDDPDILAAKGAFLVELPGMFGGDVEKGEKLLRRALSIDSGNEKTREYLAKALEASGRYRLAELVRHAGTAAVASEDTVSERDASRLANATAR